jgi:hypothetical protein
MNRLRRTFLAVSSLVAWTTLSGPSWADCTPACAILLCHQTPTNTLVEGTVFPNRSGFTVDRILRKGDADFQVGQQFETKVHPGITTEKVVAYVGAYSNGPPYIHVFGVAANGAIYCSTAYDAPLPRPGFTPDTFAEAVAAGRTYEECIDRARKAGYPSSPCDDTFGCGFVQVSGTSSDVLMPGLLFLAALAWMALRVARRSQLVARLNFRVLRG